MKFIDRILGKKEVKADPSPERDINNIAQKVYELILPKLLASVREEIKNNAPKTVRVPPRSFPDMKNDE